MPSPSLALRELQPLQNAGMEEQLRSALNPTTGTARLPSFTPEQRNRVRQAFKIYRDRKRQELLQLPSVSRSQLLAFFQRADVPVGSFLRIKEEGGPLLLFQQMKGLPFEIFFVRLRGSRHWFAIKGTNRDVHDPSHFGFSPILFDLFVHNHPSQLEGTPAIGTDLVYSLMETARGTARSFIVAQRGMTYYDGWDLRNPDSPREPIDFIRLHNEIIRKARDQAGIDFRTDYDQRLNQLHWETYRKIHATVKFKPWAAIGPEDFKTRPLDVGKMLQSPDSLTRAMAVRLLEELMAQQTGVPLGDLFVPFAQDPSENVQRTAIHAHWHQPGVHGPDANSLAAFLKSSYPDIRDHALYRLLNPSYTGPLEEALVEQILDAIEQQIQQRRKEEYPLPLMDLLDSVEKDRKGSYSESLLRRIAARFREQIDAEMQHPKASEYQKQPSPLLARVITEWKHLTAGLEEKEYPVPVPQNRHPWNIRWGASRTPYSYLDRYPSQEEFVAKEMLPALVAKRMAEGTRELRFFVGGVATAEESMTLAAVICETFEQHPDWGSLDKWSVSVDGVDVEAETVEEAQRRVNGESSLAFLGGHHQREAHENRVAAIMQTLQRNRQAIRKIVHVRQGDLTDLKNSFVQEGFEKADAIFLNNVWGEFSELKKWRKSGNLLKKQENRAFLIFNGIEQDKTKRALFRFAPERRKELLQDIFRENFTFPNFAVVPPWVLPAAGLEEASVSGAVPFMVFGPTAFKQMSGLGPLVQVLRETSLADRIIVLPAEWPKGGLPVPLADQFMRVIEQAHPVVMVYGERGDTVLQQWNILLQVWKVPVRPRPFTDLAWLVQRINENLGALTPQSLENLFQEFLTMTGLEEAA